MKLFMRITFFVCKINSSTATSENFLNGIPCRQILLFTILVPAARQQHILIWNSLYMLEE